MNKSVLLAAIGAVGLHGPVLAQQVDTLAEFRRMESPAMAVGAIGLQQWLLLQRPFVESRLTPPDIWPIVFFDPTGPRIFISAKVPLVPGDLPRGRCVDAVNTLRDIMRPDGLSVLLRSAGISVGAKLKDEVAGVISIVVGTPAESNSSVLVTCGGKLNETDVQFE